MCVGMHACVHVWMHLYVHMNTRVYVDVWDVHSINKHFLQCRSCWGRKADRTGKVPALWTLVRGRGDGL